MAANRHHVHAELAQAAQGNHFQTLSLISHKNNYNILGYLGDTGFTILLRITFMVNQRQALKLLYGKIFGPARAVDARTG